MGKIIVHSLQVSEIFESISGEVGSFFQGTKCTFIRLAGCNLKCVYCDAKDTQKVQPDQSVLVNQIFKKITEFGNKAVVITGGEPFLQAGESLDFLIKELINYGYCLSIETNGTYRIPFSILMRTTIVMDYKLNFIEKMKKEHFLDLKSTDFIKFVIATDICMALSLSMQRKLINNGCSAQFAYSPMLPDQSEVSPAVLLAELKEKTQIILKGLKDRKELGILNIQIHKLIDQP